MRQTRSTLHSSLFTLLVVALAATIPTYLIRFQIFGLPTTFWEVLLWLTLLGSLGAGWVRPKFWAAEPFRIPIAFIVLGSLIGLIVSPDLLVALGQWKAIIVDGLIFYWLVRSASETDLQTGRWIIGGVLVGGLIVALEVLLLAPVLHQVALDGRRLGIFAADAGASPNYLALYLAPLATIAILQVIEATTQWSRFWLVFTACILTLAVVVSGSRAGAIAIIAGTIMGGVWIFGRRFPAHRIIIGSVASLIILIGLITVGPSFLPDPSVDPHAANRLTSSNNVRLEIWRTTIMTIIPANPIWGIGWANFQPLFASQTAGQINYPEYITPYALHPHNFLLTTWVTLGLIGLIGWFMLGMQLVKNLSLFTSWQLPLVAALVTWLVQGLVDTPFYKNDLAAVWWFIAALLITQSSNKPRTGEQHQEQTQ